MTATWRGLLTVADLLLLVVLAYAAARLANHVVAGYLSSPPVGPAQAAPGVATAGGKEPLSSYAVIYERDLFTAGSAPRLNSREDELKPTDLNLKLWGTAITGDGADGFAIIEDLLTHKQRLYRVGDPVVEQATLKRVEKRRVILSRDGEEEVLELAFGLRPSESTAYPAERPSDQRIQRTAENQYVIDRREVEEAMQNLNKVFTQARAVPFFQNGKTVGFRVFAIHSGSIFEKIGLKNGDVIQSINGVELTDPTRALALFQELQGERHIAVELLRNNRSQNMSYEIR